MTIQETALLLETLALAYPRYANMSVEEKQEQISFYHKLFGEYETPIVATALKNYIKENEYPPTPAGLQKQINLLRPEANAVELWNTLAEICKRGSIYTQEEFDRLPWILKRWCGNIATIKELSQMDSATFNSVTRGQFLKTIPEMVEQQRVQASLPQSVINLLDTLRLGDGNGEC